VQRSVRVSVNISRHVPPLSRANHCTRYVREQEFGLPIVMHEVHPFQSQLDFNVEVCWIVWSPGR
jgi:hypothetical protein